MAKEMIYRFATRLFTAETRGGGPETDDSGRMRVDWLWHRMNRIGPVNSGLMTVDRDQGGGR